MDKLEEIINELARNIPTGSDVHWEKGKRLYTIGRKDGKCYLSIQDFRLNLLGVLPDNAPSHEVRLFCRNIGDLRKEFLDTEREFREAIEEICFDYIRDDISRT